jgi:hypothetical protein
MLLLPYPLQAVESEAGCPGTPGVGGLSSLTQMTVNKGHLILASAYCNERWEDVEGLHRRRCGSRTSLEFWEFLPGR